MAPLHHGAMVPWRHGAMVPWSHGTMVPWCHGTMVLWCHGTMVPWYHGAMVIISPQSPIINHQSSIVDHPASTINHQPSINSHQSSRYQIMAQMLFGRFWLQNKDLGPSLGAIDIIFRAGSVPMGPGGWGCARDAPHWKLRRDPAREPGNEVQAR